MEIQDDAFQMPSCAVKDNDVGVHLSEPTVLSGCCLNFASLFPNKKLCFCEWTCGNDINYVSYTSPPPPLSLPLWIKKKKKIKKIYI